MRITISLKLMVASFIISAAFAVGGGVGYFSTAKVGEQLHLTHTIAIPGLAATEPMSQSVPTITGLATRATLAAQNGDEAGVAAARALVPDSLHHLEAGLVAYDALPHEGAEATRWSEAKRDIELWRVSVSAVFVALDAGDSAMALTRLQDAMPAGDRAAERVEALSEAEIARAEVLNVEGDAVQEGAGRFLVVSTTIAVLVFTAGGLILRASIVKPLHLMERAAARLSVGDVETIVEHHSDDEMGDLANSFRRSIAYVRGVSAAAAAMAEGDLRAPLTPSSEHDVLARSVLEARASLEQVLAATRGLIDAARHGDLSARADVKRFKGSFADCIGLTNAMMEAVHAPIEEASEVLRRVADRDLTARMNTGYEGDFAVIERSLNTALEQLDEGFAEVARTAAALDVAVASIAEGGQSLAQGASDSASTLAMTVAALDQIAKATKTNAESASEARKVSEQAREASASGDAAMGNLSDAIGRIAASATKTSEIIRDINEIAFQTNMLALNAAVEAARAGDAGRGFAIVADEVRALAMRSKQAAHRTELLIQESVTETRGGRALATQVATQLESIVGAASRVTTIVAEIATSSDEQSRGIEEVDGSMSSLDRVTQENAANAEESAAASAELSARAHDLSAVVGQFTLSDWGRSAA